ncbi:uncharacterized protein LOC134248082 [Saccostrea cucullata]|uniref:uncharacterized protein LOC134248082 n=1 Tax=Saccostrea cuccullata TaxID=36930 RepID=UPI002ED6796A
MAASKPKYSGGSPQEHIQMCEKHKDFPVDMVCEDCEVFICSTCAKSDHNGHNWVTQGAAASQIRKGLMEYLKNIKEQKLPTVDEKMTKKKSENENSCEIHIKQLKRNFDEFISRLTEIKNNKEEELKDNLRRKNENLDKEISQFVDKKNKIIQTIEHMEENNNTMSDKSLIENCRDLIHLLSDVDKELEDCDYSMILRESDDDDIIAFIFGQFLDLDDITAIETDSFQYSVNSVLILEALSDDRCLLMAKDSKYIKLVNKQGEKKSIFSFGDVCSEFDFCAFSKNIYFTTENSICKLCLSGSNSTVCSTDPLKPLGICDSENDGFLVSLIDSKFDDIDEIDTSCRRLVEHLTLTGDVIREYEFQEDGQTRLFTVPYKLCQNKNSDICVVNMTSDSKGEVVIVSVSGHQRSVFRGQNLKDDFWPTDIVCDSICNILVTDHLNSRIHLLSPDGKFLKYPLTEKEIETPLALSLSNPNLWVGNEDGPVKVFQYEH